VLGAVIVPAVHVGEPGCLFTPRNIAFNTMSIGTKNTRLDTLPIAGHVPVEAENRLACIWRIVN
jgi:hypothetical protein